MYLRLKSRTEARVKTRPFLKAQRYNGFVQQRNDTIEFGTHCMVIGKAWAARVGLVCGYGGGGRKELKEWKVGAFIGLIAQPSGEN